MNNKIILASIGTILLISIATPVGEANTETSTSKSGVAVTSSLDSVEISTESNTSSVESIQNMESIISGSSSQGNTTSSSMKKEERSTSRGFDYNNWYYSTRTINGIHYILLGGYIGSNTTVMVPGQVTIYGTTYNVALDSNSLSGTTIKNLSFTSTNGVRPIFVDSGGVKATNLKDCFSNITGLETLDLGGLDTSAVTTMNSILKDNLTIKSVNLNGLDTSHITNADSAFNGCTNLTDITLNECDFSNVKSIRYMFRATAIENIDLKGCNFRSVSDAESMFAKCSNLKTVNINESNMNSITNMKAMFYLDESLETIDLNGLDLSHVTSFASMFDGCGNLYNVQMDQCDLSSATTMDYMFKNNYHLTGIELNNLADGVSINQMFYGSTLTYAHILFKNKDYLAKNMSQVFRTNYLGKLPLLVYSNSQSFLVNTPTEDHYDYGKYASDGRVLAFIEDSGEGLFNQTKYAYFFDNYNLKKYEDWYQHEKIPMFKGITNGFATQIDPQKNVLTSEQIYSEYLDISNPISTFKNNDYTSGSLTETPYTLNKSKVFNYFKDENRWENFSAKDLFTHASEFELMMFQKYTAQYAPVNPEAPTDHTVNHKPEDSDEWPNNREPSGSLGIAYQPTSWSTDGVIKLLENGTQETDLLGESGTNQFHIAVRDYSESRQAWQLSSRLYWTTAPNTEAYVKLVSSGKITLNTNNTNNKTNQTNPFNDSQLNSYTGSDVKAISSGNVNIMSDAQTILMCSNGNQSMNFYDYNLGTPKLVLPENNQTQAGTYEGYIDWNLSIVP